jgi:glycosyltransferase involved in cell wall biosynthesis
MTVAVIVPTINRAEMLPALVANIHQASHAEHRVYLVMEDTDTASIRAAETLDAVSIIGRFGSCSVAINAGYQQSVEPFAAITNDDCVFHDGWDTAALKYFNDAVHIVGMNDGYGDCKCFAMVRRSYIETHSGVYDKPNTIFHTYRSQGPDTEFAFYAMLRGVWANAPDAVVEHVNWRTGRADPEHPNYVKARETITEDLAEYNRRWPHWDPGRVMPPAVPTVQPR